MNPGQLRCGHNQLAVGLAKAGDVLGDAAVKQLHVLGQIAHRRAEQGFIPLADVSPIQPHFSGQRLPYAYQQLRQRAFSGGGRADDPQHFALFELERNVAQGGSFLPRRSGKHPFDADDAFRGRQGEDRFRGRVLLQQVGELFPAAAELHELLPAADDLLHRAQHAAEDNRGGNHQPGSNFTGDHQQGTGPQRHGLQQDADKPAQAAVDRRFIGNVGLEHHHFGMAFQPVLFQGGKHPHGFDGVGVLQLLVEDDRIADAQHLRLLNRRFGGELREQRQAE